MAKTPDAERMRRRRKEDPDFARREKATARALRRLAHEYPVRFQQLVREEMTK